MEASLSPIREEYSIVNTNDNPFDVTKAVDFTDAEIAATWVNWASEGAESVVDPRSAMPTILTGGKGGGRTHLLRYFSYPLQRLRHHDDVIKGVQQEGYLGIYFRCSGLNASRFAHKGQSAEVWSGVFNYYMEIWLGCLVLDLVADLLGAQGRSRESGREVESFVNAVYALFDKSFPRARGQPLDGLVAAFHEQQRRLDLAINNAPLVGHLDVTILASPGSMVFGIPQAATRYLRPLSSIAFVYLVDEYENLTGSQQRYVNTLIREKELPTRFVIGSRTYGLRTHTTLSAGEENREGSEYQLVVLENLYRRHSKRYIAFCGSIVQRRLEESGLALVSGKRPESYFVVPAGRLEERANGHVREYGAERIRPWVAKLRKQLYGSEHAADADYIVARLQFEADPLHEKFAILLLYRAWANGEHLRVSADAIHGKVRLLLEARAPSDVVTAYRHYRQDLYAQILLALDLPSEYYGFARLVLMSGYLPRSLLVVLKQIARWSLFLGERPFGGSRVTLRAQDEGVRDASDWFLGDAKGLGRLGDDAELAVKRLGSVFRDMRYSDKPAEVGCSSFSTDGQGLSDRAWSTLQEAVKHNLILEIPTGRRDRNSRVLHHKYQLNPMLAPKFDLSLGRRGSAGFSHVLLNSVFDASVAERSFARERRRLLVRLRPPFSGAGLDQGRLELR